jgi:hypothetical protein
MSDSLRETLLRSAIVFITIIGAVYVFFVINDLREGNVQILPALTAVGVVIALVWLNRWWYQRTGTRI